MTTLHLIVGISVVLLNLAAGAVGGINWIRDKPSIPFWYLLRGAQAAVFLQITIGGLLLIAGKVPAGDLHYVYGLLPLPVSLLAEAARAGAADQEIGERDFESMPPEDQRAIALAIVRREMGIMTVSSLVILFLALRAAGTSSIF